MPMPQGASTVEQLYGPDAMLRANDGAPVVPISYAAAPQGRPDPRDSSDKGPKDWRRDPIVWFTAAFAIGAGIIGFRFHWGPGARASVSVDVADELSSIVGQILLTIAGIAAFKMLAARIAKRFDLPALLDFADFI